MKTCTKCKNSFAESEFFTDRRLKSGLRSKCKKCSTMPNTYRREYVKNNKDAIEEKRKSYRQRNIDYTREYLESHPCVDCGESDSIVLEFDHVRGIKKNTVSNLSQNTYSFKVVKAEVEKCEIRCANCHKRKTAMQLNYYKAKK